MTPVGEILMSLMDGVRSPASLPELLCLDACRRLPIAGAGITLLGAHGTIEYAAGSDERATKLEYLQLSLGEGPCIEAFATGRLVLVTDLGAQDPTRWRAYTPDALATGVRAIFAYPLQIGGIQLGVLNLYANVTGMLDDTDLGTALHYVDAAILVLVHLQKLDLLETDRDRRGDVGAAAFETAFHTHPAVHQATGMVSVQARTGLADALQLLQARAFSTSTPIVDVARDVVSRTVTFT